MSDILNNISAKELVSKHNTCIVIIKAIDHFEKKKKWREDCLKDCFFELKSKYLNDIDIYNRCITRLKCRYNKILNFNL